MNESQSQLIYDVPEEPITDYLESIMTIVDEFERGDLRIPDFQREFVWNDSQIKDWVESIINKLAVGVIVTYQIKGGGSKYLADGRQRLAATNLFIRNPNKYGYTFDSEQAKKYCKAFKVTIQHRIYNNSRDALLSFQRLNRGTALTPKEFYSGYLMLSQNGSIVADRIPEIVSKRESHLISNPKISSGRGYQHKMHRDTYALFYQYLTETDAMSFWAVGASSVYSREKAVEGLLIDRIDNMDIDELSKKIINFDKFISSEIALIENIHDNAGGKGKAISQAVMRWILHLAIYRKNTGRSVHDYEDFLTKLINVVLKSYGKLTSRVQWFDRETGLAKYCTLSMQSLTHLKELCEAVDSEFYNGKSRKKSSMAPGYHASHVKPFSIFGDGEIIAEPAVRNIARGASPINA